MGNAELIAEAKFEGGDLLNQPMPLEDIGEVAFGLSKALRKTIPQQNPVLARIRELTIPTILNTGSLHIGIPANIGALVLLTTAKGERCTLDAFLEKANNGELTGVNPYPTTAQDIFKHTFSHLNHLVRYIAHVGGFQMEPLSVEYLDDHKTAVVTNAEQHIAEFPRKVVELVPKTPPDLFNGMAKVIHGGRTCCFHVAGLPAPTGCITAINRSLFYDDSLGELMFPELLDGETVTLKGAIRFLNESTNRIGLEYNDHFLTCYPESGKQVSAWKTEVIGHDKKVFTGHVQLTGVVKRYLKNKKILKWPHIILSDIKRI